MRILVVAGTRPEAIKLAPVIQQLRGVHGVDVHFCATGQHRDMFDQVLRLFNLTTDVDLNLMVPSQTLDNLTSLVVQRITPVLKNASPQWVVVQGDTTTAMATALAAFYLQLPVAHVQAGLRTGNRRHPFPEEVNRRIADAVSDILFAPTTRARDQIQAEGYADSRILLTGNTGIDALLQVAELEPPGRAAELLNTHRGHRLILVTIHRRESFGAPLSDVLRALRE